MSYILGALKKAEKDRRRERSLDLNDWDQESWDNPAAKSQDNHLLLWIMMVTLLLLVLMIGWLAFKVMGDQHTPSVQTSSSAIYEAPVRQALPAPSTPQRQTEDFNERPRAQVNQPTAASQDLEVVASTPTESLPDFTGHIFFAGNSQLSRVFSGSVSYREGDTVSGYLIEDILEEELVLSRQGEEVRVDLTR